ncbi:MAG: hypothetical protein KAR42_05495 [candidate division Zixibacteria bacterium]|nr:hypothetical protein [candidate division Zixibacteria bacterium]
MLSEKEYQRIKQYLEETLGHPIKSKRIAAIGVNPLYHGQNKRTIQVGSHYADLEPDSPSEQVIAIFETKLFCVVTEGRGNGEGLPYLFTRETVYDVMTKET